MIDVHSINSFLGLNIANQFDTSFDSSFSEQDDMDKPKTKVEIPALAVRTSISTKMSKELTIKAIEAKLKALETQSDDFVVNQNSDREIPLIQRYQFNKTGASGGDRSNMATNASGNSKFGTRHTSGPYNRIQRRHKR